MLGKLQLLLLFCFWLALDTCLDAEQLHHVVYLQDQRGPS